MLVSQILSIFAVQLNKRTILTINEKEDTTMKPKKKMHFQEEYELDNYLNDDDDRYYSSSSNTTIWYS